MGRLIYYNLGQSLLQSGAGISKWGNFITKWDSYYKVGQYTFVTPRQMEAHFN